MIVYLKVYQYNTTTDNWTLISNDDIIVSSERDGLDIIVTFKYPTTNGVGIYRLSIISTLDDDSVKTAYFDQIIAEGI